MANAVNNPVARASKHSLEKGLIAPCRAEERENGTRGIGTTRGSETDEMLHTYTAHAAVDNILPDVRGISSRSSIAKAEA